MKHGVIAENLIERLALWGNMVPEPLIDTQFAFTKAYIIMLASEYGVFDILSEKPMNAENVAKECKLNKDGCEKLLNALLGIRYLEFKSGKYSVPRRLQKWLSSESSYSMKDKLKLQLDIEWDYMEQMAEYVKKGKSIEMHDNLTKDQWKMYQKGMRNISASTAEEVAKRLQLNSEAKKMLDIGGSHGYYSVSLCLENPELESEILDLKEAIIEAGKILEEELNKEDNKSNKLDKRIKHVEGDALKYDLGEEEWDLIFIANLVHHFNDKENQELAKRVHKALKPGGSYAIMDMIRPKNQEEVKKLGSSAVLDLYFATTSKSGTWTLDEINGWLENAKFKTEAPLWLRTAPGNAVVTGKKV